MIQVLLQANVDKTIRDRDGKTALDLARNKQAALKVASEEGHGECVQWLLQDDSVDVNYKNYEATKNWQKEWTALHYAASNGEEGTCRN